MMERIDILLNSLAQKKDDSFLIHCIALEYAKMAKRENAIEYFEKNRALYPDYLPTYYALGKHYEEQGKNDKAAIIYNLGIEVADEQKDLKTKGELQTALFLLDE